jgi:spore maturation protein CgeB
MKVLFGAILQATWAASGLQRLGAIRALGHELHEFPLNRYESPRSRLGRLGARLRQVAFERADMDRLGRDFVARVTAVRPDVVWLEKPVMLLPEWLAEARQRAPQATFVCFQDDDPFGGRARERLSWKHFIDCIALYDLHFVKRPQNVDEFAAHGARAVRLFVHGAVPEIFHPRSDALAAERHEVVFVGTALDHRVLAVHALLLRERIPLHVYGSSWHRTPAYWLRRGHFHGEVGGERYARVLSGSKIALGYVSSSNRDEYSMRSFEIPSCGALLLAERTPAHQALFAEGLEAEFFSDAAECADKCRYYLAHEPERARIARNGHARVSRSDYSLVEHMRGAFAELGEVASVRSYAP